MNNTAPEPIIIAKIERVVASADGEHLKKSKFAVGGGAHKLFLKDEQIKVMRIENKAVHEKRQ